MSNIPFIDQYIYRQKHGDCYTWDDEEYYESVKHFFKNLFQKGWL